MGVGSKSQTDKIVDSDWQLLSDMRQAYLGEKAQTLWSNARSLELYDKFFGRRIADKWFSALAEFSDRGHAKTFRLWAESMTPPLQIWDWGCGTGRASRTFCESLGIDQAVDVVLTDKASFIEDWAFAAIESSRTAATKKVSSSQLELGNLVLLISHVINELDSGKLGSLSDIAARAEWIFWVENGSKTTSRQLAQVRNKIRHTHEILAPCLGQNTCQATESKDHTHWCHFFAERTGDYFSDAEWAEFAKQLGVDLRSIPYSFFVARRRSVSEERVESAIEDSATGAHIGRARVYKGYVDTLVCDENTQLQEWRYQKKSNADLYREFKKDKSAFVVPKPLVKSK